ncbi:MAG: SDR family NAD(P)-dependent oxidoreductase [Cyclobacteriaceae bacterium]
MELKGQLAIVTGASKGIGWATVNALLAAGCRVAGWSRSTLTLKHDLFKHYQVDVKDNASVEKAFSNTSSDFDRTPSILINNAGLGFEDALEDLSVEKWHTMFQTNVDGIFYCTRLALPSMKKQGKGHIINISSVAGMTGIPGMTGYCATKYAVRGLSQALFKEVRKFGVKVTCIYPGSVQTNFFDKIPSVEASDNMMQPEDIASTIIHCLNSPDNYHHVDIEVRPLKGKG